VNELVDSTVSRTAALTQGADFRENNRRGQPGEIELGAFLARGAVGPEHQELIRLIGTLAHDPPDDYPRSPTT